MKLAKNLLRFPYILIFSLIAGAAYFMALANIILRISGGGFVLLMFSPAIICGCALVIAKMLRGMGDKENYSGILAVFWLHIALFIICALTLAV